MKRKIKDLIGFTMGATDGEMGEVRDFYFDDASWTIRYLVVETGNWLLNRKVLISPQALLACDWESETFPVNLTQEQIKHSPDIDTDQPVSRQQEIALYAHYPWTNYWGGGLWAGDIGVADMIAMGATIEGDQINEPEGMSKTHPLHDPHLRSALKVWGYHIKALDGSIGDVADFIVDDSDWTINFMVVDTGKWFPGKRVTLGPHLIKEIDWGESQVTIKATVDQVRNSPEYDASNQLTDYESLLKKYYDQFFLHR